jgi:hypothetical protein
LASFLSGSIAHNPDALVGVAVVGVEVRAGVQSGLGASAHDVVVGEVGGDVAFGGAAGPGGGTAVLQLLANNVGLKQRNSSL